MDVPDSLARFASANDAAAATTKRLEKQAILADYFRQLPDEVLADAVRFAGGRPFATTDERVTGVSSAAFRDVVQTLHDESPDDWRSRVIKNGETGEALASLWEEKPLQGPEELTLGDLREAFDALARVGGQTAKRDLLGDVLARCRFPRSAAYVGKIVNGDLRSGAREGVLQNAVAAACDVEEEAVRRGVLLVGDLGDVAALARAGTLGQAKFRLFHPIGFMLATPQETPADAAATIAKSNHGWTAEHKLDGVRAQIHKQGVGDLARVAIYSRTLDRTDASWPDVVAQVRALPGDWLLDGEIVPWDDHRKEVTAFANVQKRLGRTEPSDEILQDYPCRFVAFDVLYRDGELLLDRSTSDRREALLDLLGEGNEVLKLEAIEVTDEATIEAAFAASRGARNEGLILKDPTSPYAPGRRGRGWLKLKTHLPTLDVVVVAAEYGHGKRRDSLSDYTFAVWSEDPSEGGELVVIGKAFSGVTDEEIATLTEKFLASETGRRGRVFDVKPEVVFEIAFDAIQESKRHKGGFALRFPRIKRIRWDRSPESADRLDRVREIHDGEQNFNRVAPAKKVEKPSPQLTLFGD